jgi:hypothetical protein
MCHSWFFGLLLGIVAFKAARFCAWRWHAHHGGGCGNRFGNGYGPGFGDGSCRGRRRGFFYFRAGGYGPGFPGFGDNGWAPPAAQRSVGDVLKSLELNQRQQEEALPVLSLLQEVAGPSGPRVEAVLLAVAAGRFEPQIVEGVLADVPPGPRRELVDGLEHLHNILIAEQRETLREQLTRKTSTTPPPSSSGAKPSTPPTE